LSILINGQYHDQVSALDRGLMYGQCLFETIAINKGQARLLDLHIARLSKGAEQLGIPIDLDVLKNEIQMVCDSTPQGVLKINLTMGDGGRGYLNPHNPVSNRILSTYDYPQYPEHYWYQGINIGLVDIRLAHQPALAGMKHGNRLEQIIARSQWQEDWQEALLLDQQGRLIEGTQSNVFLVKGEKLFTPSLEYAGVAGVMREYILSQANELGFDVDITSLSINDVEEADAVFLTNSVVGLWPIKRFKKIIYNDLTVAHKLLKIIIKNEFIPTI